MLLLFLHRKIINFLGYNRLLIFWSMVWYCFFCLYACQKVFSLTLIYFWNFFVVSKSNCVKQITRWNVCQLLLKPNITCPNFQHQKQIYDDVVFDWKVLIIHWIWIEIPFMNTNMSNILMNVMRIEIIVNVAIKENTRDYQHEVKQVFSMFWMFRLYSYLI